MSTFTFAGIKPKTPWLQQPMRAFDGKFTRHTPPPAPDDLLDPPDGSYPHVEWEYLPDEWRKQLARNSVEPTLYRSGVRTSIVIDAMEEVAKAAALANTSFQEFKKAMQSVEINAVSTEVEMLKREGQASNRRGHLMGTERDIKRAQNEMLGRSLPTMAFGEPVKQWTMLRPDLTLAKPGEMLGGITVEDSKQIQNPRGGVLHMARVVRW